MNDERFAGFDAGGTHTTCAVATMRGEVLAIGHGGPGNICTHAETAPAALKEALQDALTRAGAKREQIRAATVGVAGYFATPLPGGPETMARGLLAPGTRFEVVPDIEIALAGAALGQDAVVLIAGTGSVAYGGTQEGARARAGGWGYLLSDEGSAFWIGLQAVRSVLRALDGRGPRTTLTRRLLDTLRLSGAEELEAAVYGMPSINTGVAALAGVVLSAAAEGDDIAAEIAGEGGRLLGEMVVSVLDRLDLQGVAVPVATVGGVLQDAGSPLRLSLQEFLSLKSPGARLAWPMLSPVGGALHRALTLGGSAPDAETSARLGERLAGGGGG